jgi:hypothetical protein
MEIMTSGFDQLVDQLKIGMLPRNAQEQIIGKLEETILQATIGSIAERLSPRQFNKFERIMDAAEDPVAAIQMFIATQAPELISVVEQVRKDEVEKLRQAIANIKV